MSLEEVRDRADRRNSSHEGSVSSGSMNHSRASSMALARGVEKSTTLAGSQSGKLGYVPVLLLHVPCPGHSR